MPAFVRILSASELPPENQAREVECPGRTLCIANVNGEYSAMDNVCPHRDGPLGQGMVEYGKVVCPWHGWAFDPKTGVAEHSARARVNVFPMKIEGDDVLVDLG
jgi:nitrite reductase (NADH) small subunit